MPRFMPVLNKAFLVGNLTRDPDGLRRTPTGMSVTYLRLALNTRGRAGKGEVLEEKCFVDVSVWGRQAESAVESLGRGSEVLVEGRLWSDEFVRGGRKQLRLSVVAERIVPLGDPKRRAHQGVVPGRWSAKPADGGGDVAAGTG